MTHQHQGVRATLTDTSNYKTKENSITKLQAVKDIRDALSPNTSNPVPEVIKKELELQVFVGIGNELSKILGPDARDNDEVCINIDLSDDLNGAIYEQLLNYQRNSFGRGIQTNPERLADSFIFYNCGLKTALTELGIDPIDSATVYLSTTGRVGARYKIELKIELARLANNIDRYCEILENNDFAEQQVKRNQQCYEWLKELVEVQRNNTYIELLTEVAGDVKTILGVVKDLVDESATIKTKLEAIWINARKTKAKKSDDK